MKTLLMTILCLSSSLSFSYNWEEIASSSEGTYKLTHRPYLGIGKDQIFTLKTTVNKVPGKKTGDIVFYSEKFGKCEGAYVVGHDDESFSFNGHTIDAIQGIMCDKLSGQKDKWISVSLIYPEDIRLNNLTGPIKGELWIRHYGEDYKFFKEVSIEKVAP